MVSNKEQYGFKGLKVKGITIHNTGNDLSARENYELMANSHLSNATHFFIDEKEVVQAMPKTWCVYHTGMAKDWACKNTIAIEICRSQSQLGLYMQAQSRAIFFIKDLMKQHKLTSDDLYFHQDFKQTTYCPHKILEIYGNKVNFLKEVF